MATYRLKFQLSDDTEIDAGTFEAPQGEKGDKGDTGAAGVSVTSVEQTSTSNADGGSNVVTVTLSNGEKATFTVKNGTKGSTGEKGDTGATGAKGADGVSVVGATLTAV